MKNQIIVFKTRQGFLKYLAVALLLSSFTSCMQKLAPSYNKDIVSAIVSANKETLELLASIEQGGKMADFSKRQEKYDKIIGAYESVCTQIKARPIPDSKLNQKIDIFLQKNGLSAIGDTNYPSFDSITQFLLELRKLKDLDSQRDVAKVSVDLCKSSFNTSIQQALFYENFLER